MAIIIKSKNPGVGKPLSVDGYRGPTDYHTFADFHRRRYSVASAEATVDDVVDVARNNRGNIFSQETEGVLEFVVPVNEPRVSFYPHSGRRGLVCEQERFNFLAELGAPSFTSPAITNQYAVWGIGGAVRVVARPGVDVVSGDGTLENPQIFTHDGSPVFLERVGSPHYESVEQLVRNTSPSVVPVAYNRGKASEYATLPGLVGASEGALVMHAIEHHVAAPVGAEGRVYFAIKAGGQFLRLRRQRGTNLLNLMHHEARTYTAAWAETENTVAVTWGSEGIKFALNGRLFEMFGDLTEEITEAMVGSYLPGTGTALGGVIPNIVIYDRQLSGSELREASRSWL